MGQARKVVSFETVAEEYDRGRPAYPAALYDALGDLEGLRALDVGAGTGIATRQLLARGAQVVAVDPGREVLARAVEHTPGLAAVVADGVHLPVADGAVDLVCFAQSWHWLDEARRVGEVRRALAPGGRWAGWWSHARADEEEWFDVYWAIIEARCPGTHRGQRDTDWGATIDRPGWFEVGDRLVFPWTRTITVDDWLTDQASHSYVAGLDTDDREELLEALRTVLESAFPERTMSVRYETWLWIADKTIVS